MDKYWDKYRAQWGKTRNYWRALGADTRTANCLAKYRITTLEKLADTSDEDLMNFENFGKKCLQNVHAVLREHGHPRDIHPVPTLVLLRRLKLNSLLLAYESNVLALYDLQREDLGPEDFPGIDRDATIAKRKAAIEKVREDILAFAERD